jgi:ubiquinone biosynthesis protein Coq4
MEMITLTKKWESVFDLFKIQLIVKFLQLFGNTEYYENKLKELSYLPNDSVGREIVKTLNTYGLKLIPGFESHDLKHVLLGYDMNREDEIYMQSFMLGNRNYSITCFLTVLMGGLNTKLWKGINEAYSRGKSSGDVKLIQLEDVAGMNLYILRKEFNIIPRR